MGSALREVGACTPFSLRKGRLACADSLPLQDRPHLRSRTVLPSPSVDASQFMKTLFRSTAHELSLRTRWGTTAILRKPILCGLVLFTVSSTLSLNLRSAPGPNALPEDASWFRKQLSDGEVKPRLQHGMAANGFYRPNLARDWRPIENSEAR